LTRLRLGKPLIIAILMSNRQASSRIIETQIGILPRDNNGIGKKKKVKLTSEFFDWSMDL